jgi:hypothetical protein
MQAVSASRGPITAIGAHRLRVHTQMTREMTHIVDPEFGFGDKFQCTNIHFQWNYLQVDVNWLGQREAYGSNRPFWAEKIRAEICFAQTVSFVPRNGLACLGTWFKSVTKPLG